MKTGAESPTTMVNFARLGLEAVAGVLVMFVVFALSGITQDPTISLIGAAIAGIPAAIVLYYGLGVGQPGMPTDYAEILMIGTAGAAFTLFVLVTVVSGFGVTVTTTAFLLLGIPALILFGYNLERRTKTLGA